MARDGRVEEDEETRVLGSKKPRTEPQTVNEPKRGLGSIGGKKIR